MICRPSDHTAGIRIRSILSGAGSAPFCQEPDPLLLSISVLSPSVKIRIRNPANEHVKRNIPTHMLPILQMGFTLGFTVEGTVKIIEPNLFNKKHIYAMVFI